MDEDGFKMVDWRGIEGRWAARRGGKLLWSWILFSAEEARLEMEFEFGWVRCPSAKCLSLATTATEQRKGDKKTVGAA